VESVYPVVSWHRGLKQQGVDHVIDGVKSALGFTILWRGIWTRHPQDDPTGGKECAGGGVVEHTVVVTLDGFDGASKLRGNKGKKNWTKWEKCRISCAKERSTQNESDHQG
jgi:hypothetical protein